MNTLNAMPLWSVFLALLVFLPVCLSLGYGIARYLPHSGGPSSITDAIPGSLLGLHALLIGFTFSMAVDRYEQRRDVVVKEANAIGTAYLRTRTLATPFGEKSQRLLLKYLADKVDFGHLTYGDAHIGQVLAAIDSDLNELWETGRELTALHRTPIDGLYLSSLNEVIDLHSGRLYAIKNQLPVAVLFLLLTTLALALVSLGFVEAVKKRRSQFWLVILTVMFATVITLIIDLDRPRRGSIRVSQEPIETLYEQLKSK